MNGLINLPDAFAQDGAAKAQTSFGASPAASSPERMLNAVDQAGTTILALSFVSGIVYMLATAIQAAPGA